MVAVTGRVLFDKSAVAHAYAKKTPVSSAYQQHSKHTYFYAEIVPLSREKKVENLPLLALIREYMNNICHIDKKKYL